MKDSKYLFIITLFLLCEGFARVNETSFRTKYILKKTNAHRHKKCLQNGDSIFGAENILKKSDIFGSLFKSFDRSDISDGSEERNGPDTLDGHGLILNYELPHVHWLDYKSVFNKAYSTVHQEMAALSQWRENLKRVADHNRRYMAGEISYSLHLNQFGDWHPEDYFKKILKLFDTLPLFDPAHDRHSVLFRHNANKSVPKTVDWRLKGFKPKREEQWRCGACYAFAVTHALQAQLYKRHGDWGELSPQQIVDCSSSDGNKGCDGGSLRASFRYAARTGLVSEKYYPYTGKKGSCKQQERGFTASTRPKSWALLPAGDEAAMEKALATIGPLAVAINASPFTFQLYRSGVYDDPFCVPWILNHAMLLVGYTPDYWILLNWWGKQWGEDGYMRIRRGFNRCGVANMAAYVTL